jgi:hypothetical protein
MKGASEVRDKKASIVNRLQKRVEVEPPAQDESRAGLLADMCGTFSGSFVQGGLMCTRRHHVLGDHVAHDKDGNELYRWERTF